jgi:mRNA interferase MazF
MPRYVPERGDLVWLDFHPQSGHEQAGRRPAVVISPKVYNQKTGLAIFCPVTSRSKGYPFEVPVAPHLPVSGVVLTDQLRNLDWRARKVKFIARCATSCVEEILAKVSALLFDER